MPDLCLDPSICQPLYIVVLGIIIQFVMTAVITARNSDSYDGSTAESHLVCKTGRNLLCFYQIVSMISILLLDILDVFESLRESHEGTIHKYNCYSTILIYSSNYKTVFVTLTYLLVLIAMEPFHGAGIHAMRIHYYEPFGSEFKSNAFKLKNKLLLVVTLLCFIPYIPLLFTHCFGILLVPLIGMCFYILTIVCCHMSDFKYSDCVLNRMVPFLLLVFVLLYLQSFLFPFVMCHIWNGKTLAKAFCSAFVERHTGEYFQHLLLTGKNIWRLITYIL